ncbi:VirB8 family type IV secretion system protein [Helicobacter bizzozeronii]|uniref:type IV secretion system protein n=1 Tax=Helicobacter bizzozeronii TaxID=56877 RepID=UPI000CF08189|nr:VirB8/TrbF family protein [Helicobacter bizzozeronii]
MPELLEQRLEFEKMAERFSSGVFDPGDYEEFAKLSAVLLIEIVKHIDWQKAQEQQQKESEKVLESAVAVETPTNEQQSSGEQVSEASPPIPVQESPTPQQATQQAPESNATQAQAHEQSNAPIQEPDTAVAQRIHEHISKQQREQKLDFDELEQRIKSSVLPQVDALMRSHSQQIQTDIESKIGQFVGDNLDLKSVFRVERRLTKVAFRLALLGGLVVVTLSLAIVFMMPLVRVEPLLIDFANADKHFAIIQKADSKIEQNEALMRSLVGSYILNRETINHIDEKERYESVRLQSSAGVYQTFEHLIASEHSIYTNEAIDREVKIVNISIFKKGKAQNIATSDVVVKLFNQGYLSYEKRYRITLSFKFLKNLKFDYNSMPKNPTGFQVLQYSITEIATIKPLDETHKIRKPPRSKIIYKEQENKGEGQ